MFKLKPGNVFQKLNTMDRKKAYTIGAVVIVCFVALLTLASMIGEADDASFDGLNARGYDLAQMPFVNDEAEKYLLAAKYPDMKENGSTLLYSAEEKEARQEADAEGAEGDEEPSGSASSMSSDEDDDAPTSRGYDGYNGSGRTATPTEVKQLGTANMQTGRGGSGIQSTYGAPRGDFSPYKDQNKGSEIPAQLKKEDARKALYQFARGSRAAAGLKEGKAGNAKKALQGGNIQGSEAFTDKGVDLSKANGLAIDTNAPQESGDLSNLDKKVDDTSRKASETQASKTQASQTQWDREEELLYLLAKGAVDALSNGMMQLAGAGVDALTDKWGWTHNGSKWDLNKTTPAPSTSTGTGTDTGKKTDTNTKSSPPSSSENSNSGDKSNSGNSGNGGNNNNDGSECYWINGGQICY